MAIAAKNTNTIRSTIPHPLSTIVHTYHKRYCIIRFCTIGTYLPGTWLRERYQNTNHEPRREPKRTTKPHRRTTPGRAFVVWYCVYRPPVSLCQGGAISSILAVHFICILRGASFYDGAWVHFDCRLRCALTQTHNSNTQQATPTTITMNPQ